MYRKWLAVEPDNPVATSTRRLLGETDTGALDAYVERTFDRFADSFDAKLEHLSHRARNRPPTPGVVRRRTAPPGFHGLRHWLGVRWSSCL
jgi:hypothetical protein